MNAEEEERQAIVRQDPVVNGKIAGKDPHPPGSHLSKEHPTAPSRTAADAIGAENPSVLGLRDRNQIYGAPTNEDEPNPSGIREFKVAEFCRAPVLANQADALLTSFKGR
jgi:hypothetical protein